MAKQYFFLKLNPPRASFTLDMSNEEKIIMQHHVAGQPYVDEGIVLVLGPAFAPRGGFGIARIGVEDEIQLKTVVTNDPANGLNTYEIYPMRASSKFIDNK
ncbi:MAG: hypothetical protein Q8904_11350 [Bacteroidota bacterium]|nr:hypothetical protein [Bacteroidota bacterium]